MDEAMASVIEEIREQINAIHSGIKEPYHYKSYDAITRHFWADVNLLLEKYGRLIGRAKAKYFDHSEEINSIDKKIKEYSELLLRRADADQSLHLANLVTGKISELLSFVEELEASPPKEKVSKVAYDKLLTENEGLKKAIEVMVRFKGLPELNELLEASRNAGLPTDEHWVLALCSANLIEAIVNKKLESLGESTKGAFTQRYRRLVKIIKEKEQRDISELLPLAIYDGIRNKLDHASHSNRVTPEEALDISKIVRNLIDEIFSSL